MVASLHLYCQKLLYSRYTARSLLRRLDLTVIVDPIKYQYSIHSKKSSACQSLTQKRLVFEREWWEWKNEWKIFSVDTAEKPIKQMIQWHVVFQLFHRWLPKQAQTLRFWHQSCRHRLMKKCKQQEKFGTIKVFTEATIIHSKFSSYWCLGIRFVQSIFRLHNDRWMVENFQLYHSFENNEFSPGFQKILSKKIFPLSNFIFHLRMCFLTRKLSHMTTNKTCPGKMYQQLCVIVTEKICEM